MSKRIDLPLPLGLNRFKTSQMERKLRAVLFLEKEMQELSDQALQLKAKEISQELSENPSKAAREKLQISSFALTKEAASRVLGQRAYPVQVLGGLLIAEGMIAEMATGEGKTLTSTLPIVWFALHKKGVHAATANDYLAVRDAKEMGKVYSFLGLSVGVSLPNTSLQDHQEAYQADITYSTAQQLGFDYLNDNLTDDLEKKAQKGFFAAVIDEADSLLIDEARTPLIISSKDPNPGSNWKKFIELVSVLEEKDFEVNLAEEAVYLSESGVQKVEEILEVENLFSHPSLVHHVLTALKAKVLFTKDKDYIVKEDQNNTLSIVIVDEHTGRMMESRRYQDSLHEALEAKEGLTSKRPSVTSASVTLQSYFAMYENLGGMTGTAHTDAVELERTYNTPVAVVPTHRPRIRIDQEDVLYVSKKDKHKAVVKEIKERHQKGQPVLVGTLSVEESEEVSLLLKKENIPHKVLNARLHAQEAEIISQAGRKGAVTVATNMAGRGVDIKLGGEPEGLFNSLPLEKRTPQALTLLEKECQEEGKEVKALGGLLVLATGRNASRRVDDQLRGRSGRQGEPGITSFFLSCEDDIINFFGGSGVGALVTHVAPGPGEPVSHRLLSGVVAKSQRNQERQHADQRKQLANYDKIITAQREAMYRWREGILKASFEDLSSKWLLAAITHAVQKEDLDLRSHWFTNLPDLKELTLLEAVDLLLPQALTELHSRFSVVKDEDFKVYLLRHVLLQFVDAAWVEQLAELELYTDGLILRSLGQQDPVVAFANDAHLMFKEMVESAYEQSLRVLWNFVISVPDEAPGLAPLENETDNEQTHPDAALLDVAHIDAARIDSAYIDALARAENEGFAVAAKNLLLEESTKESPEEENRSTFLKEEEV